MEFLLELLLITKTSRGLGIVICTLIADADRKYKYEFNN